MTERNSGVNVEGGKITVASPFHMRETLKAVPGAKWDALTKCWTYPATPMSARSLSLRLPLSFPRSPEFTALLGEAQREDEHAKVKDATDLPDVPLTKHSAWMHQRQAYWFALEKRAAMLAMDMGTGKSKVTIDLIQNADDRAVLIICPKSVTPVWPKEVQKHAVRPSDWEVVVLNTGSSTKNAALLKSKETLATALGRRLLVIVNYEAVWRAELAKEIKKRKWSRIVLDESHRVKSPTGVASKFIASLAGLADRRLCLTGTPMAHNPLDIFAQYRFLDASLFGSSYFVFKHKYAIFGGYGGFQLMGYQNEDELNRRFYSLAYRVGREVLDLPEAQDETRECYFEPSAMKAYLQMKNDFIAWVDMANGNQAEINATNALSKLLRMQQITSGFLPLPPDEDGKPSKEIPPLISTAKRDLLKDTLEDLAPGEPVVVFARFRADLDAIHDVAAQLGRDSCELSGRRNDLARWQDGGAPIIAVQMQSGGVGIDLTRARYCVYYSLGFSLSDYAQSRARVHRPGQDRPVVYYHLIVKDTVDETVYAALEKRKDVIAAILQEGI